MMKGQKEKQHCHLPSYIWRRKSSGPANQTHQTIFQKKSQSDKDSFNLTKEFHPAPALASLSHAAAI